MIIMLPLGKLSGIEVADDIVSVERNHYDRPFEEQRMVKVTEIYSKRTFHNQRLLNTSNDDNCSSRGPNPGLLFFSHPICYY